MIKHYLTKILCLYACLIRTAYIYKTVVFTRYFVLTVWEKERNWNTVCGYRRYTWVKWRSAMSVYAPVSVFLCINQASLCWCSKSCSSPLLFTDAWSFLHSCCLRGFLNQSTECSCLDLCYRGGDFYLIYMGEQLCTLSDPTWCPVCFEFTACLWISTLGWGKATWRYSLNSVIWHPDNMSLSIELCRII